ncbi:ABC transporter permease [Lachnoclostridium phytofermentans]|uniref:ABC-2 type transporter n=1 Tax=Lachnoclostridium phytofermentans (strain ATCC 700394 / DSM 18823 / ISDg) TaxID=357809 RepID=A9KNR7_LACP7|nr:ABC transporter permease [Lachnoclostridium phytofermentans]ABX41668.1 ABC-2 type transporter [Lachnoclostridium phytofermentans ISDg]
MKTLLPNKRMILYELRNVKGNFFTLFFGIAFPIVFSILMPSIIMRDLPESEQSKAIVSVFVTMSMVIPMAVMLLGYAANYSQEVENEVPLRLDLFGIQPKKLFAAKLIAHLIFITITFMIYTLVDFIVLDIPIPAARVIIIWLSCLYLLAIIFFMMAHGITSILKKFGTTYGVIMFMYFAFMILCGMMGLTVEQLPKGLKSIALLLPMSYISKDFVGIWEGGSYNYAPLIQSFIFFAAIAGILVLLGIRKSNRTKGIYQKME